MKYRSKPSFVEAYKTNEEVVVHTCVGDIKSYVGDYVVTKENGEKFLCKPDVFEEAYEKIDDGEKKNGPMKKLKSFLDMMFLLLALVVTSALGTMLGIALFEMMGL